MKSVNRILICAALVAALALAAAPAFADVFTAKAGTSGVTKGLAVKFSAAGTITTAAAATDAVVGVCEQTAAASALTKYSGPGSTATVTSGEAVTAGQQVQAGTGGKAFVFQRVSPPGRVLGVALTTVAAADANLSIYVLPAAGADAGTINVYTVGATALYPIGTRYVDETDGRVFRYAQAGTAGWKPGKGAFFMGAIVIGENVHVAATAADTTVVIEQASITADAWAGGYIVVGHGSEATTQNRRILSNTASAATTNHVTVTLDGALTANLTTGAYCEIIANPYADLQTTTNEYAGVAGVPAAVATDDQYGWVQTWGPCWICPGGAGTPGSTATERTLYFVGDCSVNGDVGLAAPTTEPERRQVAGFIIQLDSAGAGGPPFVMLQISP